MRALFSRALGKLRIIATNSDWLIALFGPVLIFCIFFGTGIIFCIGTDCLSLCWANQGTTMTLHSSCITDSEFFRVFRRFLLHFN